MERREQGDRIGISDVFASRGLYRHLVSLGGVGTLTHLISSVSFGLKSSRSSGFCMDCRGIEDCLSLSTMFARVFKRGKERRVVGGGWWLSRVGAWKRSHVWSKEEVAKTRCRKLDLV